MNILVTGGAGYIGSFMTKMLLDEGNSVVVFDNLEKGHKDLIDSRAELVVGDVSKREDVSSLFSSHTFDGVIHFSAFISMAESMEDPGLYFRNNTFSTLMLLEALKEHNIKNIIFSSTAGVYGNPVKLPIPEDHPKNPTNPYGESKLMSEQMLSWYQKIYGINFVSLRYFNACGGAIDGSLGENHDPETHIIPSAINAILQKREFVLFGTDYGTPDGTAIRDYIHVLDLCHAHLLAFKKLISSPGGYIYNVGTGVGYSNKEVMSEIERVSGQKINVVTKERRKGDAERLIADNTKIKNELGFFPEYSDLETIVKSAWEWHNKNQS